MTATIPRLVALLLSFLLPTTLATAQVMNVGPMADSGPPPDSVGTDNNYYFDPATGNIFGPKASGHWPAIFSYSMARMNGTSSLGHLLTGGPFNTIQDSGYQVNGSGSFGRDPTSADNSTLGYAPGSLFQNILTGTQWTCLTPCIPGNTTWHSIGTINTVPIWMGFFTSLPTDPTFNYITTFNNGLGTNANFAMSGVTSAVLTSLQVTVATTPTAGQTYSFAVATWTLGSNPTYPVSGTLHCTISNPDVTCTDTNVGDYTPIATGQRWALLSKQSASTNQGQSTAAIGYTPLQ